MQKMKKYVFCLFFALALAASLTIGCGAGAAQTYAGDGTIEYLGNTYVLNTSGDWQYILVDGSAVVMKYTATTASVNVPSALGGYTVTAIGRDSSSNGSGAFQDNNSMQTVTIPASVTYIDSYAFKNCTGLQQVLIDNGVAEIGEYAFAECSYLQKVQIKGSALKTIGNYAFSRCAALDDLTLPESVTIIGEGAFMKCTSLSYIKIPNSVTSLGAGAFLECTSLAEAVIGNGVTELTSFETGYYGVTSGNLENHINGCFENCTSLAKVTIGSGVETISTDAFANTALASVEIPDNVVTIGRGAFYDCDKMITAQIGDGVREIDEYAFYSNAALESVSIGKNVRTIGKCAFADEASLKEITIPSNVISLGEGCFFSCPSMTKAVIGNGVTELLPYETGFYGVTSGNSEEHINGCFENCTSLSEVSIGDGVTTIGTDTFAGTALTSVEIPGGVITIGKGAFYNCHQLTNINISDSVTSIGESAFRYCDALTNIHIGKGVISIGSYAFFEATALPQLLIPSNVTSLGEALCYGDTALKKVIIGNGTTELLSYTSGYYGLTSGNAENHTNGSFENCTLLADVSLGSGLTSIDIDTFGGTALTSLLVPAKVSTVGKGAFYSSSFTSIYFTGAAPAMTTPFYTTTPALYKMANKVGYEDTGYAFAEFTPITVTFDLNNSDFFAITPNLQYMTPAGGYVIEPIDPAVEGYRFLGWYADSACTREWDFLNDRVTANTTIYAKWAKSSAIAPEAPGQVTTGTVTSTTAAISWETVDGATSYDIYVGGTRTNTDPVTATTYTLTSLTPDSTYEVTVRARNKAGVSESSLVKVVQTTTVSDDPAATDQPQVSVTLGDVDENGKVDATDALKVLRAVVQLDTLTDTQFTAADVTKDGSVGADDALQILRYVVNLINAF